MAQFGWFRSIESGVNDLVDSATDSFDDVTAKASADLKGRAEFIIRPFQNVKIVGHAHVQQRLNSTNGSSSQENPNGEFGIKVQFHK